MTKVTYYENGNEMAIRIEGHAGYDKAGQDIVCSAISVLGQTLLAYLNVDNQDFKYIMKDGMIVAYAKGERVQTALSVILTGYWLIEEAYPDYLKVDRGCSMQSVTSLDIT